MTSRPRPPPNVRNARFGGDEFVVFLSEFASENFVHKVAHRVMRVLAEPFELSTRVSGVSASIGLALVPGEARTFAELLRAADAAMYHAKRSGGNCIERYTPELEAHVQRQAGLERDLREALRRGEFELHCQPQYDCRTLKVSSAEALIRWRHPTRGLVSPCEFIPLAERSNLICEIGDWSTRGNGDDRAAGAAGHGVTDLGQRLAATARAARVRWPCEGGAGAKPRQPAAA